MGFLLLSISCAQIDQFLADIPRIRPRHLRLDLSHQTSKIYDRHGRLITTFHGVKNRTVVGMKQIPPHVQHAVVAIEDQRFYTHDGIDLKGIARAAVKNILSGEVLEGGSTITQQLVKNSIIAPGRKTAARTLQRKVDEAALARQLETKLSKNEILLRYLNNVYFGNGAYGIQTAAQTYFGVGAKKLAVKQGATLAGLIQAPEYFDPFDRPLRARKRRDVVLARMGQQRWISAERAARVTRRSLGVNKEIRKLEYPAPYFVDYVRRLLLFDERFDMLGKSAQARNKRMLIGGLRIYTTVDMRMQKAAEEAVATVLTEPRDPYGAMVAMDPHNGKVKAMVGGRDFFTKKDGFSKVNLAISGHPGLGRPESKKSKKPGNAAGTGRQAGSAFKPFALVTALDRGIGFDLSLNAPSCRVFEGADNGGPWDVCNYGSSDYGAIDLLEATVSSVNVFYARLILGIGADNVVKTAADMGIATELSAVPSAVLGTNPVNALGMTTAYGTLATNGVRHDPVAVTRIVDTTTDKTIYRDHTKPSPVLDPVVAYATTTALEQVIAFGTGTGAQIGRPAAGKTGTAQEYRDAWFAGYTPNLSAAVWVGYPEASIEMKPSCSTTNLNVCRPTRVTVAGGTWPATIWQRFMARATSKLPPVDFVRPAGVLDTLESPSIGCSAPQGEPGLYSMESLLHEDALIDSRARCRKPKTEPGKPTSDEDKSKRDKPPPRDRGRGNP